MKKEKIKIHENIGIAISALKEDDLLYAIYKENSGKSAIVVDDIIRCMCPGDFGINNCYECDEMCETCWSIDGIHILDIVANAEENNKAIKPKHYNSGKYDVIWFCEHHKLDFTVGNIIKYVFRSGKKDKTKDIEDMEKAIEYCNRRIEYLKGEK